MTIAPTRITITIDSGEADSSATRVTVADGNAVPLDRRDEAATPSPYAAAPCHCLDDEDCMADHEHE
jgi:hypothetical protein